MAWRALLHGDPVPCLLERSDPAVRGNTLRTLLERGPRETELRVDASKWVTLQVAIILKHALGEAN